MAITYVVIKQSESAGPHLVQEVAIQDSQDVASISTPCTIGGARSLVQIEADMFSVRSDRHDIHAG